MKLQHSVQSHFTKYTIEVIGQTKNFLKHATFSDIRHEFNAGCRIVSINS